MLDLLPQRRALHPLPQGEALGSQGHRIGRQPQGDRQVAVLIGGDPLRAAEGPAAGWCPPRPWRLSQRRVTTGTPIQRASQVVVRPL